MIKKGHPIIKRIEKGEGMHLDFKFSISDSLKIAKSFVAFANSGGGSLLVGVRDCGKISGIVFEEEHFMAQKAARNFTSPKVSFKTKEWRIEGRRVLEVIIPESNKKPHFVIDKDGNQQCFIRYMDNNIIAPEIWIKMQEKKTSSVGVYLKYSTLEKELLQYLQEHSRVNLNELSEALYLEKDELNEMLSDFWSVDIIKVEMEEDKLYFSL